MMMCSIKGVYHVKKDNKWCAGIGFNNKKLWLGRHNTKEKAIYARLEAELKLYNKKANIKNIKKISDKYKLNIEKNKHYQQALEFTTVVKKENKEHKIVCNYCGEPFTPTFSDSFDSSFCEFMFFVNEENERIKTILSNKKLKCSACKKEYKIDMVKKTYYPYCSRKCTNHSNKKDTKKKVLDDIKLLSEIHCSKVSNKQITKELETRILKHFSSVKEAVEYIGAEYVTIRSGFRASGRLSRAYKRDDLNGLFARSSWEASVIRALEYLEWEYSYEPKTFEFPVKKGNRFYLPDLYIHRSDEWWEIKGYMDSSSKTKINRFRKYYPENKLYILGKCQYKEINTIGYLFDIWEWANTNEIVKHKLIKKQIIKNPIKFDKKET